jgi:hypothetical protein
MLISCTFKTAMAVNSHLGLDILYLISFPGPPPACARAEKKATWLAGEGGEGGGGRGGKGEEEGEEGGGKGKGEEEEGGEGNLY